MVTQAQLLMPTLVRYLSEMLNSASGAVGVEGACTMSVLPRLDLMELELDKGQLSFCQLLY